MRIFDNVLGPNSLQMLQKEIVYNTSFPWNFIVTTERKNNYNIYDYSFTHVTLRDDQVISAGHQFIEPLMVVAFDNIRVPVNKFLRFRFALQMPMNSKYINEAHVDDTLPHQVAIFISTTLMVILYFIMNIMIQNLK